MGRAPRWLVHVEFLDGAQEVVIGDPVVVEGVLQVRLRDDVTRENVVFEAQYPLAHVRMWWCDYAGADAVRSNARPRRERISPEQA